MKKKTKENLQGEAKTPQTMPIKKLSAETVYILVTFPPG